MTLEQDIDAVDGLSPPRRPALTIVGAHSIVTVATKAALEAPAENSLGVLTGKMSAALPSDVCDNGLDAWARHGLISGAQAGLTGKPHAFPPDLPSTLAHQMLYMGAHGAALAWVIAIKADSGVTHGR